MKKIILILLLLDILDAKEIDQKMIISTHLEVSQAAKSLYSLEIFFRENNLAKKIKSDNKLNLQMELLGKYVLVTVKPIRTTALKNKLQYLFQEHYPHNFIVNDTRMPERQRESISSKEQVKNKITTQAVVIPPKVKPVKEVLIMHDKEENNLAAIYEKFSTFWKTLDMQWIGLLLLALAGFLLVYRSAKQISKIKVLQRKVEAYQTKVEDEIDTMGEKHA